MRCHILHAMTVCRLTLFVPELRGVFAPGEATIYTRLYL